MIFNRIVRYLMNHPELVEKLANSRIMRMVARQSAAVFFRAKQGGLGELTAFINRMAGTKGLDRFSHDPRVARPAAEAEVARNRQDRTVHSSSTAGPSAEEDLIEKLRKLKAYADDLKKRQTGR